ncbi:MAG: YggT family protein [Firmicutes bacterium]|nr:YggT family protein [Bacillota bacterium]
MLSAQLAGLVDLVFTIWIWLFVAGAILTWIQPRASWYYKLSRFIRKFTEPVLSPIRRVIPTGGMGMDFSPLIAIFLLSTIRRVIIQIIYRIF